MKIPANFDNSLPSVDFDEVTGVLVLKGRSIFNAPNEFYKELCDYVTMYLKLPKDLTIIMDIEYFSTKSSKCILQLFYAATRNIKPGATLKIFWKVDEDDIDMQEAAQDYSDIIGLQIEFIYNDPE